MKKYLQRKYVSFCGERKSWLICLHVMFSYIRSCLLVLSEWVNDSVVVTVLGTLLPEVGSLIKWLLTVMI